MANQTPKEPNTKLDGQDNENNEDEDSKQNEFQTAGQDLDESPASSKSAYASDSVISSAIKKKKARSKRGKTSADRMAFANDDDSTGQTIANLTTQFQTLNVSGSRIQIKPEPKEEWAKNLMNTDMFGAKYSKSKRTSSLHIKSNLREISAKTSTKGIAKELPDQLIHYAPFPDVEEFRNMANYPLIWLNGQNCKVWLVAYIKMHDDLRSLVKVAEYMDKQALVYTADLIHYHPYLRDKKYAQIIHLLGTIANRQLALAEDRQAKAMKIACEADEEDDEDIGDDEEYELDERPIVSRFSTKEFRKTLIMEKSAKPIFHSPILSNQSPPIQSNANSDDAHQDVGLYLSKDPMAYTAQKVYGNNFQNLWNDLSDSYRTKLDQMHNVRIPSQTNRMAQSLMDAKNVFKSVQKSNAFGDDDLKTFKMMYMLQETLSTKRQPDISNVKAVQVYDGMNNNSLEKVIELMVDLNAQHSVEYNTSLGWQMFMKHTAGKAKQTIIHSMTSFNYDVPKALALIFIIYELNKDINVAKSRFVDCKQQKNEDMHSYMMKKESLLKKYIENHTFVTEYQQTRFKSQLISQQDAWKSFIDGINDRQLAKRVYKKDFKSNPHFNIKKLMISALNATNEDKDFLVVFPKKSTSKSKIHSE